MKFRWWIAIAAFLVCVSLTYLPALSGHVPFPRDLLLRHAVWDSVRQQAPQRGPEVADLIALIYPFHAFAAREVRAGKLPLWNPYISSGAGLNMCRRTRSRSHTRLTRQQSTG